MKTFAVSRYLGALTDEGERRRAAFDRAMAEGWSWVTEGGDSFPERAGEAGQSFDRRSAFLPVRLEPGRSYVVWLNSEAYLNFRDPEGRVLPPLRWTFTTAARP